MFPLPDYTDQLMGCANPQATFTFAQTRISVLTPRLVRIEVSPSGHYCDAPSQQFLLRRQPVPALIVEQQADQITLTTDVFKLSFNHLQEAASRSNLSLLAEETGSTYHFGDKNRQNLPGTARTLDRTNGHVALSGSFVSRSGWTVIDDTRSLLFTAEGWLTPRLEEAGYRDLYLLVCGHDYKGALADYQKVAGSTPMIPRYALGNWWSRYWEYSDADIRALAERFEKEQIPLSVFIIDMDWHITQTGNACSGWTGFSWNRKLFPDPEGLIRWLHNKNLHIALNLHPAEGVHAHEDQYPAIAQRMEIDPQSKQPVSFDITDPKFAAAYFETILHPLEDQGVDFWWIDWQQGHLTRIPSLDPLWWLNHLHYKDLGRDGVKRPLDFSRWGGPGSHRYPIGFSGDTLISWRSLALQPYFTSSAANVAYGWWSHDIGGHMMGKENAELYTRWVQFGLLSPILRLHSTKNKNLHHLPWGFDSQTLKIVREAMQMRNALVPYLYSMTYRYQTSGIPLCLPLYYEWPEEETAYRVPGEYLFGDQLLAAPVTQPADPGSSCTRVKVWFPHGEWIDYFSGTRYQGPAWHTLEVPLERIPLFARCGAIVPMRDPLTVEDGSNASALDLLLFPGKDGHFTLYEDDNLTQHYQQGDYCTTRISQHGDAHQTKITIHGAKGNLHLLPAQRTYTLHLRGVKSIQKISAEINSNPVPLAVQTQTDQELVLQPLTFSPGEKVILLLEGIKYLEL